jgi:7-cyano-7-deazaguanine synthase
VSDAFSSACVLLSGGLDSAVLASSAAARYRRIFPLYVSSGLRWEAVERRFVRRFLRRLGSKRVAPLACLSADMTDVYGSHWSLGASSVPGRGTPDSAVYLPGRNVVLLSKAACWAAVRSIRVIEIGVLKSNPFPDGHAAFFKRFAGVLSAGLGVRIEIRAPFARLSKSEVIRLGARLPLEESFSCLAPRGGRHCGRCNKCHERKIAFFSAGVRDRTRYASGGVS